MTRLAIKASGMVTAVGFNSPASCAAMRAGIRNVNMTNLWDAATGSYLTAGRVLLPHWWTGVGKFAELAAPAIKECLIAAQPIRPNQIPIFLGVSSADRPCRVSGLNQEILGEIEYRLGFQLHPASRVIARDHVSILVGIHESEKLIGSRETSCCIIAAVDSLLQQDLAEYYLDKRRLLTPANSNGFCVGEAGSAVLLAPAGTNTTAEIEILGMGISEEKATIESDEPLRGEGLAQAVGQALNAAGLTIKDADYRISDLNGEHYKFKEMVFAMMRYERKPRAKLFDLWHPVEYIGDVGAAIGPVILGVALHAAQKRQCIGETVLCTVGNDNGERGALILRKSIQKGASHG